MHLSCKNYSSILKDGWHTWLKHMTLFATRRYSNPDPVTSLTLSLSNCFAGWQILPQRRKPSRACTIQEKSLKKISLCSQNFVAWLPTDFTHACYLEANLIERETTVDKQLAATLWVTSLDNKLATCQQAVACRKPCERILISACNNLMQDVKRHVATVAFWLCTQQTLR